MERKEQHEAQRADSYMRSLREQKKWEQIAAECARAWEERKPSAVDYAIMRMDAGFGFRLADKWAKTPEEYRELQRHCGWPPIPFKYDENPQPPGANWKRIGAVGSGGGMKYVLFISKVEGHNREKRERFFLSIRQLFESYHNTPRWNGARAHELVFFPKLIPDDCTCRWCRLARENQLGSR